MLTKRATELLFDWRQLSHFELMSSHHLIGRRVKASHLIQIKSANDSALEFRSCPVDGRDTRKLSRCSAIPLKILRRN